MVKRRAVAKRSGTRELEATISQSSSLSIRGGSVKLRKRGATGVPVAVQPILIGRDPECAVVIGDAKVSAVHVELVATVLGIRVRDLGSRNGTYLDGVRVSEAYVEDGATLSLGGSELSIRVDGADRLALPNTSTLHRLYGSTLVMRQVFERIQKSARTDLSVLIQGETGTGKELAAEAIHRSSLRSTGPFVVVDCGAIPPTLAEAILFGHERGAYTGAMDRRESPFVEAEGGTVFLDELGELPLEVQPKLLRALAESRIKSVGANRYRAFDVRVIAATRRELSHAINDGGFRSDLYFRVAQLTLEIPPLRERSADIPGLVRHMLGALDREAEMKRIRPSDLALLMRYDWPGNVRELFNVVSSALALAPPSGPIDIAAQLRGERAGVKRSGPPVPFHQAKRAALERFEREYFADLVASFGDNLSEIGRQVDLERAHVRKYLKRHGLTPRRVRDPKK
jgi:DNA-binding NtrC family response regulator